MVWQGIYDLLSEQADFHATAGWRDPQNLVFEYLREDVAPTVTNMAAAVPASESIFQYVVPDDRIFYMNRINLACICAGMEKINGFFALDELANGLTVDVRKADGSIVETFGTDFIPIRRHNDWGALAATVFATTRGNDSRYTIEWPVSSTSKLLRMTQGQRVCITVRDDLTDITTLVAMVQGWLVEVDP